MQKDLIKQRFKKSLKTYENCAVVQKEMAAKLSCLPKNKHYGSVLELGCGTGFLTKEINNKITFNVYDAVDMVAECRGYIEKINPEINFFCEDIDNFITEKKYDLIISNASLQWIENLELFTKKIKTLLNNNGEFIFTLFGKENFKEMTPFIKNNLKYHPEEELKKTFSGFNKVEISTDKRILLFKTPLDVLKHVKNTGVNALSQTNWTKKDLIDFKNNYYCDNNGLYPLTYHPVYIKLTE